MFLLKLYQEWRLFFWIVLFGLAFQVFFMYKGIENVPFFLYHMFSSPHPAADTVQAYLIKTPAGYFNTSKLPGRTSEMLMNNVRLFNASRHEHFVDPLKGTVTKRFKSRLDADVFDYVESSLLNDRTAFMHYPTWWNRYFTHAGENTFDSLMVISTRFYFKPHFHKSISDSVVFIVVRK